MARTQTPIERLAASDPVVAPLARLQVIALHEADEPAWMDGVPDLGGCHSADAQPLLHGVTLQVDEARARQVLHRLAAVLDGRDTSTERGTGTGFAAADLDPLAVLRASVQQRSADLEALAARAGVAAPLLSVLAHAAALPLLLACGRRAAGAAQVRDWPHGYCPVCAAWPTLAEVRGLARDQFLRCGRCAAGWAFGHRRCAYCGNREEGTQSYFAAEREREMRKATTCDRCHGYLKTQTTLGPLDAADVLLHDLESLDLDVVALEHGYARPEAAGWNLSLQIEPAPQRSRGWLGRWRT